MPKFVRVPVSTAQRCAAWMARIAVLGGVAFAMGACSKCDVPDFFHLGGPPGPHACHDGAPQP
jgi:hypothetical protein